MIGATRSADHRPTSPIILSRILMKCCLWLVLSFAFVFYLPVSTDAASFFVATTGSDSNPGSSALPWRTLQKAVDTVAAGDTILVRSGTYAGCRIGRSGRADAVFTLAAEAGANVLINTPGPQNRHSSLIEIENFDAQVKFWVIDGFELSGSPRYGVDIRDTDNITVRRCF